MLTELLADLVLALKSKDSKKIEKAYRTLERLGMDRMSANIILHDKESQKLIIQELKERKA